MTQANRGRIVLSTAGVLLAVAVGSYLMDDLQSNLRRQKENLVEKELRRDSRAAAVEIREELAKERAAIDESRRRIDDLTRQLAATNEDLRALKGSRQRSTNLEQAERGQWPAARAE